MGSAHQGSCIKHSRQPCTWFVSTALTSLVLVTGPAAMSATAAAKPSLLSGSQPLQTPPSNANRQAQTVSGERRSQTIVQPSAAVLSMPPPTSCKPGLRTIVSTPKSSSSEDVPPPATVLQLARTAAPGSILELINLVNKQLESQQLGHHITEAQAMHLKEVFGDVHMLLDLAGMEDNPLYTILRRDGNLKPTQIFSLRRMLRTIVPQI